MSMLWGLYGETVTRESDNLVIRGCSIQNASSIEPRTDGAGTYRTVTDVVVFMPPEAAEKLSNLDALLIRGRRYEVEGDPVGEVSLFTGTRAVVPVTVRRITG